MKKTRRGVAIGAYTSQPLGNFCLYAIDHHIKEQLRIKCYLRYCDDVIWMTKTKAEAKKVLREYDRMCTEMGLTVKAGAIISRIGNEKKRNGRKRQRGKRKEH
ncbi:RNA-directed DNA polymerase [Massilibacteroides sp.]|uniref:RNA-directed DNA polymerase n=1 Tax=Massilibacteroides sp. TaxID=2034766 RepID=UPI002629A6AC|nr:RNA-directed DNA polymerase [Massilibacteroides sp.]MDD4515112.1 RNA-directed DNA polymerase [Massilibacteroides sp.]